MTKTPNEQFDAIVEAAKSKIAATKPAKATRRILSADPEIVAQCECWKILDALTCEQRDVVMAYLIRKAGNAAIPRLDPNKEQLAKINALIGRDGDRMRAD